MPRLLLATVLVLSIFCDTISSTASVDSKNASDTSANSTLTALTAQNLTKPTEKIATLVPNKPASSVVNFMEGGPAVVKNSTIPQNSVANTTESKQKTEEKKINETVNATAVNSRPFGREHITESSERIAIPVVEHSEEPRHSKIVPRKEAILNETSPVINSNSLNSSTTNHTNLNVSTSSTTTTTTTTTTKKPEEKPRKPLVTEDNGDKSYPASHFVSSSSKNSSFKTLPLIEQYEFRKSSGSDYIFPIVGVILSVPLVSILLNVIYKKTKEWWYHRHYSRMDFLVDGMYNN